jgi:flagellar basal body-associated protein FliL
MANEKPAAAPAPAPAEEAKDAPKKKGGMKMIVAAAVVVVLEVATVFVTAKMAGGPKQAMAAPPTTKPAEKVEKDVEVKLIDTKLPNKKSGRLFMFDLGVVVTVEEQNKDKVTALFTERDAEIKDQVRAIIASSNFESFDEPGLETLRRQICYQLEQDIGKDLIKEVLIPKCTPIRAE